MKRTVRRISAFLLSVMMMLVPNAESIVALALSEPFDRSELSVPEELQDGSSWYFIHQSTYSVNETNGEKIYIPIQRTGDLSREGDVSLKLIDVTARHDVNYKEEMYRENPEIEIDIADVSVMEMVESAYEQEELEEVTDEEIGEAIVESDGADFIDAEGNVIGEITAQEVDEDGNPVVAEEEETPSEEVIPEEETVTEEVIPEEEVIGEEEAVEEETVPEENTAVALESDPSNEGADWEEGELTGPAALRHARDEFTGTVSDRQQLEDGDGLLGIEPAVDPEASSEMVEDSLPGKIYNLHFEAGEDAKYLVITPLYDDAADGDSQMMIMLKNPDDESQIAENFRLTTVNFIDDDELQAVRINMADELVVAKDGKASITVTREGMKNSLVGIHLSSWGGSAVMGEDYGGVGADLYFPMGITSRTVELPVAESEEQKDFYVTLTADEDANTEIEQKTVHVVIPAAGQSAQIMASSGSDSDTVRVGDPINLQDLGGSYISKYFEFINGGTGFSVVTKVDQENLMYGLSWFMPTTYFYDGIMMEYGMLMNWCDAEVSMRSTMPGEVKLIDYMDDGGWHDGRTSYLYFGRELRPEYYEVGITNVDNENPFADQYTRLVVSAVRPILRQFKVSVTDGVMADGSKPSFAGMDAATAKEQTAVILNDGTDSSCKIWGNESFSISQVAGQKYVRLVAIDAIKDDGKSYRIAAGDGLSQTLVGELNEQIVNELAQAGFVSWSKGPGQPQGSQNGSSLMGSITVRPVFEYYNAKVEIKESQYGNLVTSADAVPTLLWDFNSDKAMTNAMYSPSLREMTFEAADDYYTFTATGSDPQVKIDMGADDVSEIQWVKVRARTSSKVDAIELYGHTGDGPLTDAECAHIDVNNDGEWHTYIINIPEENVKTANAISDAGLTETAWQGKIEFFRLDPMWNKAGNIGKDDTIDIDYIAFFESKERAEDYRESTGTRLLPGVYNFHIGDLLDLRTELSETGETAGLRGDGFRYNLYTERNGEDIGRGTIAYANGTADIKLRGTSEDETRTGVYYRLEPTFTETVNQLVVQVEEADLAYFDTEEGVLNTAEQWVDGTVHNFVVARDIRSNEVFELWAETLDSENIPLWTGSDNITCSGDAYYMMSGVFAADNIVKLSVDTDADAHAYYSLSGNVYAQIMNLSTGRPSSELVPAKEALVTAGYASDITAALPSYQPEATTDTEGEESEEEKVVEDGQFTLPAIYLVGNTSVRYTVTYNGNVSIREAKLAPAGAKKQEADYNDPSTGTTITVDAVPVTLNTVAVDSWSVNSAHFGRVDVEQDGVLNGVINTVQMNGKKVVFTVHVEPGQPYTYNNQQFEEKITKVTMYFQSQKSKAIHGVWSSDDETDETATDSLVWDEATNTATLTIDSVSPEATGTYAPNDVLMLQLSTDKKVALSAFTGKNMVYDPVSSGITMVSDLNFEPQALDFDVPSVASFLQISGGPNENGTGVNPGNNFGRFPFLGEINTLLKVATDLSNYSIANKGYKKQLNQMVGRLATAQAPVDEDDDHLLLHLDRDSDLAEVDDEGLDGGVGNGAATNSKWGFGVLFTTKKTYWNGVRLMIAAVATYKGGSAYKNSTNPLSDRDKAWNFIKSGRFQKSTINRDFSPQAKDLYGDDDAASDAAGEYIYDGIDDPNAGFTSKGQQIRSEFGGSRFTLGFFFGVYLDFGYIVENGKKSGHVVFMGGGGFGGAKGTAGYTFYSTFFGIPIYVAPEGSVDFMLFGGYGADPATTLDAFQSDSLISLSPGRFRMQLEITGRLEAGVSFGVGIYKVLGARLTAAVGFNAGYGTHMDEWFPKGGSNAGFTTDFTASGTLDLVITELQLFSMTFPLPWSYGWMKLADEIILAKKVVAFTNRGIAYKRGTEADRATAQNMSNELFNAIDDRETADADSIHEKADALRSFAYNAKILDGIDYMNSLMTRVDGTIGVLIEEWLYDEGFIGILPGTGPDSLTETEGGMGISVRTRDHVSSQWTGEQKGLFSTFKPVEGDESTVLEKDAYSQTSSEIIPIGNNKYLVVYLTDNSTRDRQMASQLVYTIYDASSNTWVTKPQPVQYDATADGKPHLTDAGDKVILTWSSIPDEKYAALKAEVAAQLKEINGGVEPLDETVAEALESDPAKVMSLFEIYSVEFDKASMSFAPIDQLTDDEIYDDNPQAVYDSETGDYIVLYYKTSQDETQYTDSSEKLLDMAGLSADPDKTYSLICYMLYNNQTETPDTKGNVHEAGWARDYLFPNETVLDEEGQEVFLAEYKGQRFLPSSIRNSDDPDMEDPAIGDMTVSAGYNGLAAFAFTVDRDFNLTTGEDRELYMQFYDFAKHSTYVPVKVAGEQTDNGAAAAVEVGMPKLVRNDGSTWLFWREDGKDLRYLNVSEMLNDRVAAVANPDKNNEADWTYALKSDGTFATDAVTGDQYSPKTGKVEFGSLNTSSTFSGSEYEVVTDENDNLYVVWSDTVTIADVNEATGELYNRIAQEIYATAMVRDETSNSIQWAKPNRLTKDNNFNDGIAIALDEDGNLLILHNQYEKKYASTAEEIFALYEEGALFSKELNGQPYLVGSLWYNSPNSLVLTRCEAAGSVEATAFSFSHRYPVPNDTIEVFSIIENTGLTTAEDFSIVFYENKDGVRGDKIAEFESDERLPVNNSRSVSFRWETPEEGVDGYRIEAEIVEKKASGSSGKTAGLFANLNSSADAYEPVISYSDTFNLTTALDVKVESAVQNGDAFDITWSVYNRGNKPASEGTEASLYVSGLYGDIKELYGMDSALLVTKDIEGLEPRETRVFTETIELPLSLFEFCGYDALEATVTSPEGDLMNASDQLLFGLEAPIHLSLNDGNDLTLNIDDEQQLTVGFDTDVFVDVTEIVYSVDDTSVAAIDENGVITALGKGITTITATLLPSGRTITMTLTVLGENGEVPEPTPTPSVEPEPTPTPTPEVKPADDKAPNTYDSYPVKYLWTGAGALLVAIMAFFLRLKNRK